MMTHAQRTANECDCRIRILAAYWTSLDSQHSLMFATAAADFWQTAECNSAEKPLTWSSSIFYWLCLKLSLIPSGKNCATLSKVIAEKEVLTPSFPISSGPGTSAAHSLNAIVGKIHE